MGGVDGSIAPMVTPESATRELRENTTDGAAVLARRAISLLSSFVAAVDDDDLPAVTRRCAEQMRNARPTMAAVGNLVRFWMESFSWPHDDFRRRAMAHCESILARADRALAETVRNARNRLAEFPPDSVFLTHSASSTVRSVIDGLPFRLLVTASEPGGEGRRMARELGVTCVEDVDAPSRIADVAAVVVGADAVGREAFVNKVGTRALAQAARKSSTPFFVVTESYKCVAGARPIIEEDTFEAVENGFVAAFLGDARLVSFAATRKLELPDEYAPAWTESDEQADGVWDRSSNDGLAA
ncbi:MAG: hypothetical protein F4169_21350 [Gammaproteobacteria bacterium]|nr:hypothetical protein [Gammaproteobacteria bacterium]